MGEADVCVAVLQGADTGEVEAFGQLASYGKQTDHEPIKEPPLKKAKRTIDEDDYDDEEEEEDEEPETTSVVKVSHVAVTGALPSPSKSGSSPIQSMNSPNKLAEKPNTQDGLQSQVRERNIFLFGTKPYRS